MNYQSTRTPELQANSAQAVLQGLAPDGGLYVLPDPQRLQLDVEALMRLDVLEMAGRILQALLPDYADMPALVERAYHGKFDTPELTPLRFVGPFSVLELYHGPTSAFKDVALSMLPQLMRAAREEAGTKEDVLILTATSGDTGKAALEGFRDVPGTRILVFYPDNGVSQVQKAQMVTQEGANVHVCAVRGNFDDAQTGVKAIFSSNTASALPLSSANSINIGRLAPQVVYYFKAYAELCNSGRISFGTAVDYVVPTGNFGDILAGYLAKLLGLPVGRLVCASNANDVLTEFLRTGVYNRLRPFHKTLSPSMDILVSSNLERLLYYFSDGDCKRVSAWMRQLAEEGHYSVEQDILDKLHTQFWAGCSNDEQTKQTIGQVWRSYHYLIDTHTAVAWNVAEQYRAAGLCEAPVVILSTASAYKFPAAVLDALGQPACADEFDAMRALRDYTGVRLPSSLAALESKPVLHTDVIERSEMPAYVRKAAGGSAGL